MKTIKINDEKLSIKEDGMASVEAIVSLTIFVFCMMTIYSIVNLCIVQEKVQVALNESAKEISQYTYFYYAFGLDKTKGALEENQKASLSIFEAFNNMTSQREKAVEGVGKLSDSVSVGSITDTVKNVENFKNSTGEFIDKLEDVKSDPSKYAISFISYLLLDNINNLQATLTSKLAKNMSYRHFENIELEKMGVVGGFDGISFDGSSLLSDQKQEIIELKAKYKLSLVEWLPIDLEYEIYQTAKTRGWAGSND